MVKTRIRALIKLSLGQFGENRVVMFKKLLLATLIVIIGLWGAGYDVTSVKDGLQNLADESAQTATGGSRLDKSD